MMTSNPITHTQAKALAAFVHELRPDWDKPGILHAIGQARDRDNGTEVAIAAIKAASSPKNRTPAVIPLNGDHWREQETATTPSGKCATCGAFHPGQDCPGRPTRDHAGGIAAVKVAYAEALTELVARRQANP